MSYNPADSKEGDNVSPDNYTRENVSYLYSRDPSIINYGPRPTSSIDSKKNLMSLLEAEDESILPSIPSSQTIRVYLRLKPFSKTEKITDQQLEAYTILDSTTLLTKLPPSDLLTSSIVSKSSSELICKKKFTFTDTFGPETTQYEFFDRCIKSKINEFISGQNYTIMTYGTTNSGKSYTLQGTSTSPGIIPRSLEFLFSNVSFRVSPSYKPINDFQVVSLKSVEKAQEVEIKNNILAFGLTDKNQYKNSYEQMQKILQDEDPNRLSQSSDAQYSVWVSFAEIYNETIYDLLSNESHKCRTSLKLATDNQGRAFIKGLKNICVNSGLEAFQILMAGQYNLKVAATALNARSSRSHCIFTIKLLKYSKESDPDSVKISTFSFCDLAGSERLKKTLNIGERLREAQNINTSLMVFGRCLKSIYEGQNFKNRSENVGPFRDSKLTRLFQKPLSGKEQMTLIVNVNPSPNLYVETQNVLNFAAIAKKIVVQTKKVVKRRRSNSQFSQVVSQNKKNNLINWNETVDLESVKEEEESDEDEDKLAMEEKYDELLEEYQKLQKENQRIKKSALQREMAIRTEMSNTYSQMMKKIEDDYKKRLKDAEDQQEDMVEWSVHRVEQYYIDQIEKLKATKERKKRRFSETSNDEDDDDDYETKMEQLEIDNLQLKSKVSALQTTVQDLKNQVQDAMAKKNSAEYELSIVNEDLKSIRKLVSKMEENTPMKDGMKVSAFDELTSQLEDYKKKNNHLQNLLNQAKTDYIDIENELKEKEKLIEYLENTKMTQNIRIEELEEELENLNDYVDQNRIDQEKNDELMDQQNQKLSIIDEELRKMEEKDKKIEELNEIVMNLNEVLEEYKLSKDNMIEKLKEQTKQLAEYEELKLKNESNSIIQEKLEELKDKLNETKSEKLAALEEVEQYKEKCDLLNSTLIDITKQLDELKATQESSKDLDEKKQLIDELKTQVEILQESDRFHINELEVLKRKIDELLEQAEIKVTENDNLQQKVTELEELKANYSKIFEENENKIRYLQDKLTEFNMKNLENKMCDLTVNLEKSKLKLEEEKEKSMKNMKLMKEEMNDLTEQLQEKDKEISRLEQEIKKRLQLHNTDETVKLETELKKILKEKTDDEEIIKQLKFDVELYKSKVNDLEMQVRLTNIYKKQADDYQYEIEKIKADNENFIHLIDEQTRDMENFKKNRDQTMSRYEYLLKNAQDEIDRQKREVVTLQKIVHQKIENKTPSKTDNNIFLVPSSTEKISYEAKILPEKDDNISLTSEDEGSVRSRSNKRRPKVKEIEPNTPGEDINEMSVQSAARNTRGRKKKLFNKEDLEVVDLEPTEESPQIGRKLRTRAKK